MNIFRSNWYPNENKIETIMKWNPCLEKESSFLKYDESTQSLIGSFLKTFFHRQNHKNRKQ